MAVASNSEGSSSMEMNQTFESEGIELPGGTTLFLLPPELYFIFSYFISFKEGGPSAEAVFQGALR